MMNNGRLAHKQRPRATRQTVNKRLSTFQQIAKIMGISAGSGKITLDEQTHQMSWSSYLACKQSHTFYSGI